MNFSFINRSLENEIMRSRVLERKQIRNDWFLNVKMEPIQVKQTSVALIVLFISSFLLIPQLNAQSLKRSDLPDANQKVLRFVDQSMGKKLDRGECWDLAALAVKNAGGEMNGVYDFGRRYNRKSEPVLPGDIIQIFNVKTKYVKSGVTYYGEMPQHTAIIYKVLGKGKYVIAEQNGTAGRKVAKDRLYLSWVQSGKIRFYRPEN